MEQGGLQYVSTSRFCFISELLLLVHLFISNFDKLCCSSLVQLISPSNTSASPVKVAHYHMYCRSSLSRCALSTCHIYQIRALWVLFSVALLGLIMLPTGSVTADWIIAERLRQQSVFF